MNRERDNSLDMMKGILTILMTLGHVWQFFGTLNLKWLSDYINLTTFSCFMFIFGCTTYKAYFQKELSDRDLLIKTIKNFVKTLIAYYISGIAYEYYINNNDNVLDILIFKHVAGYSEFLLSFAFLYILIYLNRNIIRSINTKRAKIIVIITLLLTFIPYKYIDNNIIGVFIGTYNYHSFPLVQYSLYFITGLILSKYKIVYHKKMVVYSIYSLGAYLICNILFPQFEIAVRFPPNIFWIVNGYFIAYGYYIICNILKNNNKLSILTNIGKNTLSYLVISNLIIFIAYKYKVTQNSILICTMCIVIPYLLSERRQVKW